MRWLVHRECWSLSWQARVALLGVLVAAAILVAVRAYAFLAPTERVSADLLIVEGWIHPYAVHAAADEFTTGTYRRIVVTGGPVEGSGGYTNDYNTSASVGAGRLRDAGIAPGHIAIAPARFVLRDRTYASAVALRAWLREHAPATRRLNIVTADAHARRTRLLFQLALGDDVAVGVIAVPSPDYDAARWWRSSEGLKTVLGEGVAYLYAKFVFQPPSHPDLQPLH